MLRLINMARAGRAPALSFRGLRTCLISVVNFVERPIDQHRCDITHVTERKGSPQTLVCTKTQESYERQRKQFGVDQTVLAELEKLAKRKR